MKFSEQPLRAWLLSLGLIAIGVVVAFIWLDRPIAYFVHTHVVDKSVFIWMQRLPEILPLLSATAIVSIGLLALGGRPLTRWQSVTLLCGLSFIATAAVNSQLKFAFGRTWPETWINNNPSLIHDGAFGFNPFHGGPGFASFPSGHTAAICSVMSVLWLCYPRGRAIWAICVAVVVIGLLGADFHFLSDILAGGFLGASAGRVVVRIWESRNVPGA
jgi:membrane-associated phospholipid phosphatase